MTTTHELPCGSTKISFRRFRTAHSLRQPRTAEGLPEIGSPQARGAVDTRDWGSVARDTAAADPFDSQQRNRPGSCGYSAMPPGA